MLSALDFLGRWKWPNLIAVTVVPAAFYLLHWSSFFTAEPFGATMLGPAAIGPWTVVLGTMADDPAAGGRSVRWRLRFCGGCWEQLAEAEIALGTAAGPGPVRARVSGNPNALAAVLDMPARAPGRPLHLWLLVRAPDGRAHALSWPLAP